MTNELRGFLVADHPGNRWHLASPSEHALRENIRASNVRVCEHFITAARYSGARAKIIALLVAMDADECADTASDVEISLDEQRAQCMTDPLQMEWMTGQMTEPSRLFALTDCFDHEIAQATRARNRVALEAARAIGLGVSA
jgi:hypothetical protein